MVRQLYDEFPIEAIESFKNALGDSLVRPEIYQEITDGLLLISDRLRALDYEQMVETSNEGLADFSNAVVSINIDWIYERIFG